MKINERHIKAIEKLIPEKERQIFLDKAVERALKEHGEVKPSHTSDPLEIFIDGGSRGNPGPSGGGFAVYKKGKMVIKGAEFFGEKTNNQAEYLALREALRKTYADFGDVPVHCFMDSELVVEQMNGNYKVRSENVRPLFDEVSRIKDQFCSFKISHVRREQNKVADKLANEAMNRG